MRTTSNTVTTRSVSSPPNVPKVSERLLARANYYSTLIVAPKDLYEALDKEEQLEDQAQMAPHPRLEGTMDTTDKVGGDQEVVRFFHVPFFIIFVRHIINHFATTSTNLMEGAIFAYHVVNLEAEHCTSITADGPVPRCSVLIFDPYRRHETWRYVSYMLVHSGYVHVLSNLVVQLTIGLPLEIVHGWVRVGAVYASGVLSGSLITSVVDNGVFLCGASAGVYALIAAHLPVLILNWRRMHTIVEYAVSVVVVSVGLLDLIWAVYQRYMDAADQSVAYAAHLAGGAAGLLVGITVLGNNKYVLHKGMRRLASLICYCIWSSLILSMLFFNLLANLILPGFFPPLDLSDLKDCRYHDQNGCYAVF